MKEIIQEKCSWPFLAAIGLLLLAMVIFPFAHGVGAIIFYLGGFVGLVAFGIGFYSIAKSK